MKHYSLPTFSSVEGLATFLADLRCWSFASKLQAASYFGLSHTTVLRYESGQLRAPSGYLAALIALLSERLPQERQADESDRQALLQAANQAILVCYAGERPFASWELLQAAAQAYSESRRGGTALPDQLAAAPAGEQPLTAPPPLQNPAPAELGPASVADPAPTQATPVDGEELQRSRLWGDAPDTSSFLGREQEVATLAGWIRAEGCRVLALIGMGGIGKTALAARVASLVEQDFEVVIWCSLLNAPPLSQMLADCLRSFPDQPEPALPERQDRSVATLLELLYRYRCLVVFDNVESILRSEDWAGEYQPGYEDYGLLLRRVGETAHRSSLILTSRECPRELILLESRTSPTRIMQLGGLGPCEAAQILGDHGLIGDKQRWTALTERYAGNPLALKLVSGTIRELFDGDIASFLGQSAVVFGGLRNVLDEHFERLSEAERDIMYWLTIEHEPVTARQLREQSLRLVSERVLLEALQSLRRRSLIEKREAGFTLQNVIMEYMLDRLVEQVCHELLSASYELLISHPLLKATAKDYIREAQMRLVGRAILERLVARFGREGVEARLRDTLARLHSMRGQTIGYAGGNVLNLLLQLKDALHGYDFSGLQVWGAYLKGAQIHELNFAQADLSRSVFTETFGPVLSVACSPDARYFAVGTTNGEIRVWSYADAKQVLHLKAHGDWVRALAFSPDGRTLASASDDQTLRIWELEQGRCLRTFTGHTGRVLTLAFSPDGAALASGGEDQTIRLWEPASARCRAVLTGHSGWVCAVRFSGAGDTIISAGSDQTVRFWDGHGQCRAVLTGQAGWIWAVDASADGRTVLSAGMDHTIHVWDSASGQCVKVLEGHADGILTMALSPDQSLVASGSSDLTIRLWELESGRCLRVLHGHTRWVRSLAFSPDGRTLISSSTDETIRHWDVQSGRCEHLVQGYTNCLWSLAVSPSGRLLASGGNQSVQIWEVEQAHCWRTLRDDHKDRVWSVAFSPDDQLLASVSDEAILIREVSSGQLRQVLHGHGGSVRSLDFSPDGRLLASGSEDRTIGVWDVASGRCLRRMEGHGGWVWSVAFSPDGQLLASGCDDQIVWLWDAASGRCLRRMEGHTNSIWSVAFSPDGRLVASGSDDQLLRLWDVASGTCSAVLEGHAGQVWSVAFHPGGALLASGSADGNVYLWDVASGRCLARLHGHRERVRSVRFSPDGATLASCGDDGAIRLWDVATGAQLRALRSQRPYEGSRITGATGLTEAQKAALKALGAVE